MPWTYTAIMILAVLTGALLARRSQQSLDLSTGQKLGIGIGAFCGAMIAAKLPFVLADWEGFLSGRAWLDNGKTIVFGLVGGYFGVEIAKWSLDVRTKTGDSFAVPVAAAIGVGRLACFVAPCCYGTPTDLPWGVDFGLGDRLPRHPTQLYEFAFHLGTACTLEWLGRKNAARGQRMKLYILLYAAFRFVTEFVRPEPELWLGLTGYQWGSAALIPLFLTLWLHDQRQFRAMASSNASVA